MVAALAIRLLRLIFCRIRQRPLVIEHRAEIAHVDPATASFASEKVLRLVGRLGADAPYSWVG